MAFGACWPLSCEDAVNSPAKDDDPKPIPAGLGGCEAFEVEGLDSERRQPTAHRDAETKTARDTGIRRQQQREETDGCVEQPERQKQQEA